MEVEFLTIFDGSGEPIGTSSREDVHLKGFWHETFHCWIISKENSKYYLHFQLKSSVKKEYPNLLDISAAGHINATESVSDGIREIHEELGINVSIDELIYLGKIQDEIIQDTIIDREIAHVFVYLIPSDSVMNYTFQIEEVSGMFKVELDLFEQLWLEKISTIRVHGQVLDDHLNQSEVVKNIDLTDFLPHNPAYISAVLKKFKTLLNY